MKRIIKRLSLIAVIILASLATLVLASCRRTKTTEFKDKGEVGSYYQYGDIEKSLVLDQGNVTLNTGSGEVKGTYSYDGEKLVITIDGVAIETTYGETTIGFTYAGNEYLLYRAVDYTVSFEANGGSEVASITVKNGKKATKPADPTKEEYIFAGWYKDAGFTQAFDFSTEVITKDTKVYAKYESDNEINVFFETGIAGVTVNKVRTVDHVVKGLPELNVDGKTFIGWFESDYGTADRLSRVFKANTEIEEEITLYAVFESDTPVVSVEADKIVILGVEAAEYTLVITNTDDAKIGEVVRNVVTTSIVDFQMSSLPPANYTVAVQTGGKTGVAYIDNSNGEWESEEYKVTLDYQYFDKTESKEEKVTLGTRYALPVPQAEDALKAFVGWYSSPNAQGLRYTDETGASLSIWYDRKDLNLYAAWMDVFTFELINDGNEYQVKKGPGIEFVKEVTVPSTYNGKLVSTVAASAFSMCQKMLVINIPNTITNVEIGANGPTGTGSAFSSCTKLTAVNVYEVEGFNKELAVYESDNGSLLYHSETMGVELVWFPYNTFEGTYRISDKVEVLPMYCFRNSNKITEIVVPATVRLVDYAAFYGCNGLLKITFEEPAEGVTAPELELGEKIFASGSIVEITLPSRLRNFSSNMFASVTNLATVNVNEGANAEYVSVDGIVYNADKTELLFCPRARAGEFVTPVGVQVIGESAFEKCINLTKVTISGQIRTISKNAFKDCTGIVEIDFAGENGDDLLTICEGAFSGLTNPQFQTVTLPANLISLEKAAFGGCSSLGTVRIETISPTVTFADGAFGTNAAVPTYYVTDLYIGKDVAAFNIAGVFGSTSLVSVEVEAGNENYVSVDGVLYNMAKTQIAYFPAARDGAYEILSTVTSIGANVFEGRRYITSVTIPKGVTSIGDDAFKNCVSLTSVVFEEGGTENLTIGNSAFQGCTRLTSINLPTRLRSLGNQVFYNVNGLREIIIPEGCESIGTAAFQSSLNLTKIVIPSTLVELAEAEETVPRVNSFDNCPSLTTIEVAAGNANYAAVDGLLYKIERDGDTVKGKTLIICPAGKGGKIEVPADVIRIANKAFAGNTLIEEVKFTGNVEEGSVLGLQTFYGNDSLKTIILPEGIETIATSAITNCKSLTSITIPGSVATIQKLSIVDCINLTDLIFVDSEVPLRIEGEYKNESSGKLGAVVEYNPAFKNTKIAYLNVPERTVELGASLFAGNLLITEITIPKNVTKIGNAAFSDTKNLKKVTFAEGSQLQVLGETPKGFAGQSDVFYNSAIEEIILPEGLLSIGTRVFGSCFSLKKVYIPSTVAEIPGLCFLHTPSLEELTFGEGSILKTIGSRSLSFSGIKSISIPKTVESIVSGAFAGSSLETITFETDENGVAALKTIGDIAFQDTDITEFRFPYTGKIGEVYNTITIGSTTSKKIFEGCKNLEKIYVTENVKSLEEVIEGCTALKEIVIAQGHESFKLDNEQPIIFSGDNETIIKVYGPLTGEITIPSFVRIIADNAFYGQTQITKVTIPATVREIGNYAFYRCTNLETVVFEDNDVALDLGTSLFSLCTSLKNVKLSNNISYLNSYMFFGCSSLENVTIPTTVKTIYDGAFANCPNLKMETLPASVTTLGTAVFYGSGITKFTLPEGVTSVDQYTFKNCTNLTEVSFPSTLGVIPNEVCGGCTALTKVTISEGTYRLGSSFQGCTALEEITLPESLEMMVMVSTTYADATVRTNVGKLPTTVTALSYTAKTFYGCTALKKVVFTNGCPNLLGFGANTFEGCSSLTEITLPEKMTWFGNQSFADCTSLEKINIPAGVKVLGSSATIGKVFMNCHSLKEITLPEDMVSLFGYVFQNCTSLEKIVVPAKVTKLGNYIFDGCTALKEASIEGVIATKGTYVFSGCTALEKVEYNDNNTSFGNYMFLNCTSLKEIKIPSKYTAAAATTATYVFQGCTSLESVTFPAGVGYIGNYFFEGCTGLKKVTFAGTQITGIGNYAFANCSSLTEIAIPQLKTPTAFGTYAFENCTSLKKVEINSATQTIGNYAFRGCTSLETITLPADLKTLGTEAFANSGLVSIMIPAKVTTIGSTSTGSQFKGCANLEEVVFLGDITTIGAYAFADCTSLETIEIPASVTYLGKSAFSGAGLKTVVIPTSVASIYGGAFNGCDLMESFTGNDIFKLENGLLINKNKNAIVGITSDVTDIVIPEGMTILESALEGSHTINSITLPSTFTEIADYMFEYASVKTVIIQSEVKIGEEAFKGSTVEEIVGAENITAIGRYAFEDCANLKSIALSDKLTELGGYAFRRTGLESVTVPGTVKWLGTEGASSTNGGVFQYCENLTSITLSEGIEHINAGAFAYSGVTSIVIPSTVYDMGSETMLGCNALKDVVFNGSTIGESTFYVYNKLLAEARTFVLAPIESIESITINGNIQTIPAGYFMGMVNLKTLVLPETIEYIGNRSFYACRSLANFEIPSKLMYIDPFAFYDCSSLEYVKIPGSVKFVDNSAFANCASLKKVDFEEGCIALGGFGALGDGMSKSFHSRVNLDGSVFAGCTALEEINLPSTLKLIGGLTFSGCTSLTEIVIPKAVAFIGSQAFAGWTSAQTVNIESTEYEAMCLYYMPFLYTADPTFYGENEATFVYNYKKN